MGKQKHDIGHQKQGRRKIPSTPTANTDDLARDLVSRGISTPTILNAPTRRFDK